MKQIQFRLLRNTQRLGAAAALTLLAASASAQMRLPSENYVGLQLGRSELHVPCASGLDCARRDTSYKFSLGRQFTPIWGAELSILDAGKVSRAGGQTQAQGANASLVGRLPMGSGFGVFGKVGTTYSRTRTSAVAGSGIADGRGSGWGPSYGAGLSYDLTPNWTVVAEWERNRMRFAGDRRDDVDNTSLGMQFRF